MCSIDINNGYVIIFDILHNAFESLFQSRHWTLIIYASRQQRIYVFEILVVHMNNVYISLIYHNGMIQKKCSLIFVMVSDQIIILLGN